MAYLLLIRAVTQAEYRKSKRPKAVGAAEFFAPEILPEFLSVLGHITLAGGRCDKYYQ